MKQKFVPIHDRVLLHVQVEEKKSAGGIVLPIEHVTATVLAVGPGAVHTMHNPQVPFLRAPLVVKAGDKVALPRRYKEFCEEVLHDGEIRHVTTEANILGILESVPSPT